MELLLLHGATAGGPRDDYWPLVQRCTAAGEPSSASARTAGGAPSSAIAHTAAGAPRMHTPLYSEGAYAALAARAAAAADAAEYPLGFPVWNDECREWREEPPSSHPLMCSPTRKGRRRNASGRMLRRCGMQPTRSASLQLRDGCVMGCV